MKEKIKITITLTDVSALTAGAVAIMALHAAK